MLRFDTLRGRLLTVLGTGAFAAVTTQCAGSAGGGDTRSVADGGAGSSGGSSNQGGSAGSGGSGKGGTTSQGGSAGKGGSSSQGGSISQGGSAGVAGAAGGNGGVAGSFVLPMCPTATDVCKTKAELTACIQAQDAGTPPPLEGTECPVLSGIWAVCTIAPTIPGSFPYVLSGPTETGDSCCYVVQPACPAVGRPFVVEGAARIAEPEARSDWSLIVGACADSVPEELAEKLAAAWQNDALYEHASIASFARFSLELLALGAPPDLIADAQRAALDEIRHARLCFALSSRYSGKAIGPSALDVGGALEDVDLARMAVRCVEEGCVGETVAALFAAEQAKGATDPVVRRAIEGIAEDEARHAELAWRAVRWAIEQGGAAVRASVASAFQAAANVAAGQTEDETIDVDWRAHGRLGPREAAEIRARALREVVAPCVRALLNGSRLAA